MAQFQVPQFIETEDRVVGPLTWRQFVYIAVGGALSVILFLLLNTILWFMLTLLVGGIAVVLAFVPVNGRPIIVFLRALFDNIWRPKIYVFQPKGSEKTAELPTIPVKLVKERRGTPVEIHKIGFPKVEGLKKLRQWFQTSKTVLPKESEKAAELPALPTKLIKEERGPTPLPKAPWIGLPKIEGLKALRQWLQTSKTVLPKREKPPIVSPTGLQKQFKEQYEIVRRLTGEKEVARRVDYR